MKAPRGPYAGTDRRREEIIQAAFEVFSRQGYRGGSMREIADIVGVSHSSLKYHFGTKEDLLLEVIRRRGPVELPVTEALTAEGGALYAVVAMAHYNARHAGLIQLHTTVLVEALDPEHPARQFEVARYRRFREWMARGLRDLDQKGLLVSGIDVELEADNIAALMDGVQIQWLLDPRIDMAAHVGAYVDRLQLSPVRRPTAAEIAALGS